MLLGTIVFVLAVMVLAYAFSGSRRVLSGVMLLGLLAILGAGFLRMMGLPAAPRPLVELGPQRLPSRAQAGPAATTQLFGVEAKGHSFMYVIDLAGIPVPARTDLPADDQAVANPFAPLAKALQHSVTDLQRNHRFQILTFAAGEVAAAIPSSAANEQLFTADTKNIVLAIRFLDNLTAVSGSAPADRFRAKDALYQALTIQPDVIYFVTTGHGGRTPTDNAINEIKRWNTGKTALHVIQVTPPNEGEPSTAASWLETLAKANRGSHQTVRLAAPTAERGEGAKVAVSNRPEKQPDWIAQTPPARNVGESQRIVVTSGASRGDERARDHLDDKLLDAAAEYADRVVEPGAGAKLIVAPHTRERILQYLATQVVKDWHAHDAPQADMPMEDWREHLALLEFNTQSADYFRQEWRLVVQQRRLWIVLGAAIVLLGLIGTLFLYLKSDGATRGQYRGRLRLLSVAILMGLCAGATAIILHARR